MRKYFILKKKNRLGRFRSLFISQCSFACYRYCEELVWALLANFFLFHQRRTWGKRKEILSRNINWLLKHRRHHLGKSWSKVIDNLFYTKTPRVFVQLISFVKLYFTQGQRHNECIKYLMNSCTNVDLHY